MAALNPRLIKETQELIDLYQNNQAFRERFDMAVKRNVNVTYKNRPLKLYFEVLANSNPKYKDDYVKVRRIIRHDLKNVISEVFLNVTTKDLENLGQQAKQAESNTNSTTYSAEEINEINHIEETAANPIQKRTLHTSRLEKQRLVAKTPQSKSEEPNPSPEPEESKEPPTPPSSPSSSNQPNLPHHAVSEKAPSTTTPTIHTPTHDLADDRRWSTKIGRFFRRGAVEKTGVSTVTEGAAVRFGGRFAVGRAISGGAGKLIAKAGVGAATKAGAALAKIGVSIITGVGTGGVGLVVSAVVLLASTFSGQIKKIGKLLVQIFIGLAVFILFMLFGHKLNILTALLPPYEVSYAEPLPVVSPSITPSVSPPTSPTPSVTTTPPAPITPPDPSRTGHFCPASNDDPVPPDDTDLDFRNTMSNQGRKTNILGNRENFVNTVIGNGAAYNLQDKRTYLEKIYDASIAQNVNPLIVLVEWGVDQAFNTDENTRLFGCPADRVGFDRQLECAANTFDYWMKSFEGGARKIDSQCTTATTTCTYTDAFIYAYEWYGPVCHANDSNGPARNNFLNYYRALSGI